MELFIFSTSLTTNFLWSWAAGGKFPLPQLFKLVSHLWIKLLACVRSPAFAGWPFIQWLLQTTSLQKKTLLFSRFESPPQTAPHAVDCHRLVTPSLVLLADRQIAHATTVKVKSESNFATHFLRLEKQNFVLRFCKAAFLHFCTFSFPFDILQFWKLYL